MALTMLMRPSAAALPGALTALGATGKAEEIAKTLSAGALAAPLIAAVGLGQASASGALDAEALRRSAGAAVRALSSAKVDQDRLRAPRR